MRAPGYDITPPTPRLFLWAIAIAILATVITLIVKRPKFGSRLSLGLILALAILVGFGGGWYARIGFDHQMLKTMPDYIDDCPNC